MLKMEEIYDYSILGRVRSAGGVLFVSYCARRRNEKIGHLLDTTACHFS